MPKIEFKCPKCSCNKIVETMVDTVVHTEISIIEVEDGIDYCYGEQINEDGHVDYYQCGQCGFVIVDGDSPHADDGLDADALAKALKELAGPTKMRPLEMAIAYGDATWKSGIMIEIPDEVPEEQVDFVAVGAIMQLGGESDVAHIWVYNNMEDDRPE